MIKLRQDGEHWTAFDPHSGLKVTASPTAQRLIRPNAPELVDISVTDYCSVGCSFCYRDSTRQGQHASMENLKAVAQSLQEAGTFEVALGGGEITEHPQFLEILKLFSEHHLVTNFTTRKPATVAALWPQIEPLVGALAISTNSAAELRRQHAQLVGVPPERVNIHIVMGTVREESYLDLLLTAQELGHRVTLLGYKTTGRGLEYRPLPHDWWIQGIHLARHIGLGLSIDTTLAALYQQDILDAGVPQSHFHIHEGQYSAFIDAVKMTVAKSSYEGTGLPFHAGWLQDIWPALYTV